MKKKDQIKKLVELQEISKEMYEIEKMISEVPRDILDLREYLRSRNDSLNEMDTEITKYEKIISTSERRIEDYRDKLTKSKDKEHYISTQEQFEKLDEEQNYLKDSIKEAEEEIVRARGKIEELSIHYDEISEKVDEKDKELIKMEEALSERKEDHGGKLQLFKDKRSKIIPGIDSAILSYYERIADHNGGVGIVPVEERVCTGCNISIPSTIISEITKMDDISTCGNCGKIIYLPEALYKDDDD